MGQNRIIFEELNSIVEDYDPEGLMAMGARRYEYDLEVDKILENLSEEMTEWEVEAVVGKVFSTMFGTWEEDFKYRVLSKAIYEWLQTGPFYWTKKYLREMLDKGLSVIWTDKDGVIDASLVSLDEV
ncbi:MAG: hypothetical protein RLY31_2787 [Bacteroidota bacterium]